MIVDNVWKLTNTVRVGLDVSPHTQRENPLSRIMCASIAPPVTGDRGVTKMLSFCDNKYFPSSWKDDDLGYLSMDLKSFYVHPTQGEVKDSDGQVNHRINLDELVGMSTVSMVSQRVSHTQKLYAENVSSWS
jgi:hypothetical protein